MPPYAYVIAILIAFAAGGLVGFAIGIAFPK